ncbi:hypothetical protein ACQP1W_40150 [Spirillospora sp. CA-255316]
MDFRSGRRAMLLFGALSVLSACSSEQKSAGEGAKVRTDTEPLERRFRALGPLSDAHWLGYALGKDSRGSVPGPTDVRVVGIARLGSGRADAIVRDPRHGFRPETPTGVPEALAGLMPKGARWLHSGRFDAEITATGAFYLDPVAGRAYFDTLNPEPSASPGP